MKTERKAKIKTAKGKIFDLLSSLKSGETFLIDATAKEVTQYSYLHGVKVSTAVMLLLDPKNLTVQKITKVTIL